jgi:hypothetical protein
MRARTRTGPKSGGLDTLIENLVIEVKITGPGQIRPTYRVPPPARRDDATSHKETDLDPGDDPPVRTMVDMERATVSGVRT